MSLVYIGVITESGRGAIRAGLRRVAVWWSQLAGFAWSSLVRALPHSLLHVFR